MTDLQQLLIRDEGLRLKPYVDTAGKVSIGVGRNLDDKGITEEEAMMMLNADIYDAMTDAKRCCSIYDQLSRPRQLVLIAMAFNLGAAKLNGFVRFINALHLEDWDAAADEMLNSKAAKQAPQRYSRLAGMMRSGVYAG